MSAFKDLTGLKFNMLTVIKRVHNIGEDTAYECLCDCGNIKVIKSNNIKGQVKSCGCLWKAKRFQPKHKLSHTKVYNAWVAMRKRCSKPNEYPTYRNISVCKEWIDSFEAFFTDMGHPPTKHHTLDRKDNLGNYCKDNCRWATYKEQNRNYSQNRILEARGEKRSVTEWAEKLNIPRFLIYGRLVKGWDAEKALFTPNKRLTS